MKSESAYYVVAEDCDQNIVAVCRDLESAKDAIKEDYADVMDYGTEPVRYSIIHGTKTYLHVSTKVSLDVVEEVDW